MKAAFLAVAVLAAAGVAFYFGTARHASRASDLKPAVHPSLPVKSLTSSLPLFFEPNQGQTAPQVKFLARGSGYGLFLTADEAVLQLRHAAPSSQPTAPSVIRMRLSGANPSALVSGASPLPGKSNYFIGNDSSKWRHNVPQFARVQYQAVYPGVDLVYYGNQGQLEYDFRVAAGADPNQIALSFTGASARIDAGNSGDLILSTSQGEVRFHAPRVYQPSTTESEAASGATAKAIAGSFRQLADNKIGFTIGDYDHSRELVIDPILTYLTYIGGSGTEGAVSVAVDSAGYIYLAGTTTSTDFPLPSSTSTNPPYQPCLGEPGITAGDCTSSTATNVFIAVLNTTATSQLVYATYLGGSGVDIPAGIAVDQSQNIYVAGTTTSPNSATGASFPTTTNAFLTTPGTTNVPHGFLSKFTLTSQVYSLTYSTYLAGNGADNLTGLAIDSSCIANTCNAYVTGNTTSTNVANATLGFPANPNGYQTSSNGSVQFFASKINPNGSGSGSMLYSTYFGGGNYAGATTANVGGGIAVDSGQNMYITGTTNMLPTKGPNGEAPFPLFNAQQTCLDEPNNYGTCLLTNPTATDAFVAKINTNPQTGAYGADPVYSTYIGGNGIDTGNAIAVDTSSNAYVTGSTFSTNWTCNCAAPFQTAGYGGNGDAYLVQIINESGSIYPVNYFTYLGGSGSDVGQAIQVDSMQTVHIAGTTYSSDFPAHAISNPYAGNGDAFVALISITSGGTTANPVGDYVYYLGGGGLDQGTGIALDTFNATYVAGSTESSQSSTPPFPVTSNAFQPQLNGPSDAFVAKFGASSTLTLTQDSSSPTPSPVPSGTPVKFTFDITNGGPDIASNVTFYGIVPTGLTTQPTATITGGEGSCTAVVITTYSCTFPTLAVGGVGAVTVNVVPPIKDNLQTIAVSGSVSANYGPTQAQLSQIANVVDFGIAVQPSFQSTTAGSTPYPQFTITYCPTTYSLGFGGYSGTITPSQTSNPSIVTATTPTFNPTTVTLSGTACGSTVMTIATVARPITTGSLLRHGSFYATWLPIGGLSLAGLGIGVSRKRRRWLIAAILCLIAGIIVLQPGCGSASNTATTSGGTQPGNYIITVSGAAATGASHNIPVTLQVN